MMISRRFQAAASLIAVASCGVLAALPASASASVVPQAHHVMAGHQPGISGPRGPQANSPADAFSQESCNGDVCMILAWDGVSTNFTIIVGANSNPFDGYFHMAGPGGPFDPANTPTRHWNAHGLSGGGSWEFVLKGTPMDGNYCMSAFTDGSSIGKTCVLYGIA